MTRACLSDGRAEEGRTFFFHCNQIYPLTRFFPSSIKRCPLIIHPIQSPFQNGVIDWICPCTRVILQLVWHKKQCRILHLVFNVSIRMCQLHKLIHSLLLSSDGNSFQSKSTQYWQYPLLLISPSISWFSRSLLLPCWSTNCRRSNLNTPRFKFPFSFLYTVL